MPVLPYGVCRPELTVETKHAEAQRGGESARGVAEEGCRQSEVVKNAIVFSSHLYSQRQSPPLIESAAHGRDPLIYIVRLLCLVLFTVVAALTDVMIALVASKQTRLCPELLPTDIARVAGRLCLEQHEPMLGRAILAPTRLFSTYHDGRPRLVDGLDQMPRRRTDLPG